MQYQAWSHGGQCLYHQAVHSDRINDAEPRDRGLPKVCWHGAFRHTARLLQGHCMSYLPDKQCLSCCYSPRSTHECSMKKTTYMHQHVYPPMMDSTLRTEPPAS